MPPLTPTGKWTNRGKYRAMKDLFNPGLAPSDYYFALATKAVVPTELTNVMGELVEIAPGHGYTSGGIAVTRDATGFPAATEDDPNNRGFVRVRDLEWIALGGSIPLMGDGIRFVLMIDKKTPVSDSDVLVWWDLVVEYTRTSGESFIVAGLMLRGVRPGS